MVFLLNAAVQPLRVITGILPALDGLAREFRGLRGDMREVIDGIEQLRGEVRDLQTGIATIADATVSLDGRVSPLPGTMDSIDHRLATLHHDLAGVSSLAQRMDRIPRLRRARPDLET